MYLHLNKFVWILKQINIGVLETNPISVAGAMEVGMWLGTYVPKRPTGDHWPILCYRDQLSMERMVQAWVGFSTDDDAAERQLGLEPVPQELHMRNILIKKWK